MPDRSLCGSLRQKPIRKKTASAPFCSVYPVPLPASCATLFPTEVFRIATKHRALPGPDVRGGSRRHPINQSVPARSVLLRWSPASVHDIDLKTRPEFRAILNRQTRHQSLPALHPILPVPALPPQNKRKDSLRIVPAPMHCTANLRAVPGRSLRHRNPSGSLLSGLSSPIRTAGRNVWLSRCHSIHPKAPVRTKHCATPPSSVHADSGPPPR